mgnify:CR=1 FL=1
MTERFEIGMSEPITGTVSLLKKPSNRITVLLTAFIQKHRDELDSLQDGFRTGFIVWYDDHGQPHDVTLDLQTRRERVR